MYGANEDAEEDVLASKDPQVTSQDPNERKAARALRIKRRQEALKRSEQPAEEAVLDDEPNLIEQSTATAAEELQQLSLDGAAKVTNIKVTTDEREVIRRALFSEKMKYSLEKIELEATEAQIKYEAITSNWDSMLAIKDPLDIDAAIKEQKMKCDELLEDKNEIIKHVKHDLKNMDQSYYDDLAIQDNYIKELSERIEKQVTIMQRAYEKQLELIGQAITIEREAMIDHNNKRWDALYKQRDKEEVAHMEYKFQQMEETKTEIENIMWDHHAKYREAKIELESLIQELQKELEKLKATCIINTEKIGYNYQVLRKREEENVFVRSQQKRKLNKMSDIANKLRSKIRKAVEDGAIEEIKADAEIVKLMQAMDDLEKKCSHFAHVNNYKFSQVWKMSALRCAELAKELRQAEVALHAHILAEPPPSAPPSIPKSPLAIYEAEFAAKISKTDESVVEQEDPKNAVAKNAKEKLVRHILQLVADNTGFLVEDRLLKLIEKYQLSARNLCTLDSIFMALEIQAEEDVELLCKTFLNYAFCPVCIGVDLAPEMMEPFSAFSHDDIHSVSIATKGTRGERSSIRPRISIARSISASTSRSAHVGLRPHELQPMDHLLLSEAEEILQKCKEPQVADGIAVGAPSEPGAIGSPARARTGTRGVTVAEKPVVAVSNTASPFLCPMGHNLEIEPMQVLTALGEFISLFVSSDKRKLYDIWDSVKPPDFTTPSRRLKAEEIELYWTTWKNIFPSDKDRFWDGLLSGLNNYLATLQERERLHDEVVLLRRRNAALRGLVRGALPELRTQGAAPHYERPYPPAFTSTIPDNAPVPYKLPPI